MWYHSSGRMVTEVVQKELYHETPFAALTPRDGITAYAVPCPVPSGEGHSMEQVKVAESKAIEVMADEPDPKLSANALRVLEKRYLKKDDQGRVIETPRELFARVAWNLAQAERNYGADKAQVGETARRFYRIMANLDFLPNSPTLMNAGLELQLLSACFVLPVDDSLVGIFEALKQQALIHQAGGGTGFCFSRLRRQGGFVKAPM